MESAHVEPPQRTEAVTMQLAENEIENVVYVRVIGQWTQT